jgi:hypothetical protein
MGRLVLMTPFSDERNYARNMRRNGPLHHGVSISRDASFDY